MLKQSASPGNLFFVRARIASHKRRIGALAPSTLARSSFHLKARAPEIAWAWHPCGKVIARAELTFLLLDNGIVHVNVVEHGGQILVPQQFLEAKWIIALEQIVHRKGMA